MHGCSTRNDIRAGQCSIMHPAITSLQPHVSINRPRWQEGNALAARHSRVAGHCHGKSQLPQLPQFDEPERERRHDLEFLDQYKSKLVHDRSIARSTDATSAIKLTALGVPLKAEGNVNEQQHDALMQKIKSTKTLAALSSALAMFWTELDMVQTTAALVQVSKLNMQAKRWGTGTSAMSSKATVTTSNSGHGGNSRQSSNTSSSSSSSSTAADLVSGLLQKLLPRLRQVLPELDAQGVSNVIWSLAKLQHVDEPLLADLLVIAGQKAQEMNAQNMSNVIYALALLEEQHTSASRRQHRNQQQQQQQQLKQQIRQSADSRSAAFLSSSGTGHLVSSAALLPLLAASGPKLYMFSTQALSNTIWALARLGCKPTVAWLQAFLERSSAVMHELEPRHMANITWALHKLAAQPDPDWVDNLVKFSYTTLNRFSYRDLANLAWALANLGVKPPAPWVQELCMAAAVPDVAGRADAAGVAGLLYALSRWQVQPPQGFQEALFKRSASPKALKRFTAIQLCDVLRALAHLSILPPDPWATAMLLQLGSLLQDEGKRGLKPSLKLELQRALHVLGLTKRREYWQVEMALGSKEAEGSQVQGRF